MEDNESSYKTMFKAMLSTLDEYESIIKQFKAQLEHIQLSKKLMEERTMMNATQNCTEDRKRESFDKATKEEAIELCAQLMESRRLSKHRAAKRVGKLMDIKPRTIYAWIKATELPNLLAE